MPGIKVQITLPENIEKMLQELSRKKGLSKSVIVSLALEEYWRNDRKKEDEK